jgi:hypothetical protein
MVKIRHLKQNLHDEIDHMQKGQKLEGMRKRMIYCDHTLKKFSA